MVRALFSPRMIGLHLLALVATTVAAWLGFWQYDAWQTRRELAAVDLANAEAKQLTSVMSPDAPFPGDAIGQPVDLEGLWVPESTFYAADRERAGNSGFWVVTPVAVCDPQCDPGNAAMPVVRGWTATPDAAPAAPTGEVTLTGWLQPPEGTGRQDPDPNDDVLQELRIADAIQQVDQDLYGAYLVARDGLERGDLETVTPDSLPAPSTFTSLQNLLYAVEWWLFGAFAVFLWQRWVRDELERRRAGREDGSGADHADEPAPAEPDDAGIRSAT